MKCQIETHDSARPRNDLDRIRALLRWPVALIDGSFLWLERNRQRRLLHSFSNHMLKDIGLSRADVEGESGKHPWQE
jgi:uncharacterized protein YjiS (DUF1127 family)